MCGMVNKASENMVVMHHGEAMRERIKAKSEVDGAIFIGSEGHSEEVARNHDAFKVSRTRALAV